MNNATDAQSSPMPPLREIRFFECPVIWMAPLTEVGLSRLNYVYDATFIVAVCGVVIDQIAALESCTFMSVANKPIRLAYHEPCQRFGTRLPILEHGGTACVHSGDSNEPLHDLTLAAFGDDFLRGRTIAHIVFEGLRLTAWNNMIPDISAYVVPRFTSG